MELETEKIDKTINKIINGKELSLILLEQLKVKYANTNYQIAILYFKDYSSTDVYIRNIKKNAEQLNVEVLEIIFDSSASENYVIDKIIELNNDSNVNGIFISSDTPKNIDFDNIVKNIDNKKDIDCATPHNIGQHFMGCGVVAPCTASSVIKMIEMYFGSGFLCGKSCVVIGRNNVVGKPIAISMLQNDATITICHSKTKDIAKYTKDADIVVVSVGIAKFLTKDMVNVNSIIIDVGINFDINSGKVCGDADFENLKHNVKHITPVPNGVGAMTSVVFFDNLLKLIEDYKN